MVCRRRQQKRGKLQSGESVFRVGSRFQPGAFHDFLLASSEGREKEKAGGRKPEKYQGEERCAVSDSVSSVRAAGCLHPDCEKPRTESLHPADLPEKIFRASPESEHENRRQLRIRACPLQEPPPEIQQRRRNDFQLFRLAGGL